MNHTSLRFTLSNAILGPQEILDPIGWDTNPLSLTRDTNWNSVLETFSSNLTFFGVAIPYLASAQALGIDTVVTFLMEITQDYKATYTTAFSGIVDLESLSDLAAPKVYKVQGSIINTSLWSLFKNRLQSTVDVTSTVDVDGNPVAPISHFSLPIPGQIIRQQYNGQLKQSFNFIMTDFVSILGTFIQLELDNAVYDEVQTRNILGDGRYNSITDISDKFQFAPLQSYGTYDVNINLEASMIHHVLNTTTGVETITYERANTFYTFYLQFAHVDGTVDSPIALTTTVSGTGPQSTTYSYSASFTLKAGDRLKIYAVQIATIDSNNSHYYGLVFYGTDLTNTVVATVGIIPPGSEYSYFYPQTTHTITISAAPSGAAIPTYMTLEAHTTYPASVSDAVLVYDHFDAIVRRITGGDNFYSTFFGGISKGYLANGCGYPYANLLGLWLRGFAITAKPMSVNMQDSWNDANAIWPLGLGIENISGTDKIVIEQIDHFLDSSADSIQLSFVTGITQTVIKGVAINSVTNGFNKWQLSSGGSLIDDPQTQHTYTSPFKLIGQALSLLSNWIAASLLFEQTRRTQVKTNQTYDTDNNIFILNVKSDLSGPDLTGTATNLADYASRYNKTMTPARLFIRRLLLFNIGLTQYIGKAFKFTGGLGNFLTSVTITPDSCLGTDQATVTENADIPITSDVLNGIYQVDFEYELTWNQYVTIRNNKNKSIGVSATDTGYKSYFIKNIQFYFSDRKAKFTLFSKA